MCEGVGGPNSDDWKKAEHSAFSVLHKQRIFKNIPVSNKVCKFTIQLSVVKYYLIIFLDNPSLELRFAGQGRKENFTMAGKIVRYLTERKKI